MKSRTVWFIPEPFVGDQYPIALLSRDDDGSAYMEPIPVLAELSGSERYLIAAALAYADKYGNVSYHPRIQAGPWQYALKSLSPPEFAALVRILNRPEQIAKLQAHLDKPWHPVPMPNGGIVVNGPSWRDGGYRA